MDYIGSFEAEILLLFPEESLFVTAQQDMEPNGIHFKEAYTFPQASIYLDTDDFQVGKNHSSLAMRLGPNNQMKVIMKYGFCSLLGDKLLVKAEIATYINQETLAFPENFSNRISTFMGTRSQCFHPQLVVNQKRMHRVTYGISPKLHLSFDEVNYINPMNDEAIKSYMLELEVTDSDLDVLKSSQLNHLCNYYVKNYGAKIINPSKYHYGLQLMGKRPIDLFDHLGGS